VGKTLTKSQLKQATNDVIKGNYGNGQTRKNKLGSHYTQIQNSVNEKLGVKKSSSTSSTSSSSSSSSSDDKMVEAVIRGKYGNGAKRKKALGKDYATIQKKVNTYLKKQKSTTKSTKKTSTKSSAKAS
jgi:hypothetical protein